MDKSLYKKTTMQNNVTQSFPNMTSLMQYIIWKDGEKKISASGGTILTAKARAAGNLLVKQGLASARLEGNLIVFMAVAGKRLDRQTYPIPPANVSAWV